MLTTEVMRTVRGASGASQDRGQKRYVEAIAANTVTFGIGPAGTGKSWLAVAMAVDALQAKRGGAHRAHPAGGGGRRAAGIPARAT